MDDLPRDALEPCLLAQASITGAGEALSASLPLSLGWLRALWDAGDDHFPLDLVHDLGLLLVRGRDFRFGGAAGPGSWFPARRTERLAYEDRVLGRWALDPSVMEAHVIVAGLPPSLRDPAVVHALRLALGRVWTTEAQRVPRGNPAHLRALVASPEFLPRDWESLAARVDDDWVTWATERRRARVESLGSSRLLSRDALWEIEHLPELPSDSARLALRQLLDVAESVAPVGPAVMAQLRQRVREVVQEADEADQYPAGGFDAVSTRGTFENLVRSEVAYVGEGCEEAGGVDLFDVRFAESELLYYTRDQSPLLDARRLLTAVIDRPAALRHKVAALSAQTLVLVEGAVLVLQRDLLRAFGPTGSALTVVWRIESAADRAAAEEDKALLALRLGAEIEHRRVSLEVVETWDALQGTGRMVFSPTLADPAAGATLWFHVGEAAWTGPTAAYDLRPGADGLRTLLDDVLLATAAPARGPGRRKGRTNRRPRP